MNKLTVIFTLGCLIGTISLPVRAQEETTGNITTFIKRNPICQVHNVIYEGTKMLLCSDGEMLLVQLQIRHPALQIRILMEGLSVSIDPTGKRKEKYILDFPAGNNMADNMMNVQGMDGQLGPQMSSDSHDRPDLMPLLRILNAQNAVFRMKGEIEKFGANKFVIEANKTESMVVYSCLIPIEPLLSEKRIKDVWTIGLYSINDIPSPSNFPDSDVTISSRSNRPQNNEAEAEDELLSILQNDIECWVSFSISEISSLNE